MPAGVDVEALTERLAVALVRDRPVVIWSGVLAGATDLVHRLAAYGAGRPLVVAGSQGTGNLPTAGTCDVLVLGLPPVTSVSEEVRREGSLVGAPPTRMVEAIEAYDPARAAVCFVGPFGTARELVGRRVLDGRFPDWAALEDKTLTDELCRAAGVPLPPAQVTPAEAGALLAAAARLDNGRGTVWSGDATQGMNGGADLVRRVGHGTDPAPVIQLMVARCRSVRVAPFLEGVPCSVHGIVTPDGVAVLRPVEMVMLRGPGPDRFTYGGASMSWDPHPDDREAIRSYGRRMGEYLAARVGFRGGFSLDGVLGASGFVATEVNPRFTGGLGLLAKALPEFPLRLMQAALVSGVELGVSSADLERVLLTAADEHRGGGAMGLTRVVSPTDTVSVPVVADDVAGLRVAGDGDTEPGRLRLRVAGDGETEQGRLMLGPAPFGGLVLLVPGDRLIPRGARSAPYALAALALADSLWGTEFGLLEAARDVRRARSRAPRRPPHDRRPGRG